MKKESKITMNNCEHELIIIDSHLSTAFTKHDFIFLVK